MELIVIEDDLMDKLALMSDVKKQGINELVNDYISRGLSADGISYLIHYDKESALPCIFFPESKYKSEELEVRSEE